MKKIKLVLPLLLVLATMIGCSSMQSISSYARTGDTVMVSLGGSAKNALVPVLRKENISATITDSLGNESAITIRNLFKIYADGTSLYNYQTKAHLLSGPYVSAYQGQWMAVLDLVDPVTSEPVNIASGQASIAISSIELDETFQYYNTVYNGNLSQIPIEIIDGIGSKNPMNYLTPISESPLNYLEPLPQVLISPQGAFDSENITIGGLEYTISFNTADFRRAGNDYKPNVAIEIPDSKAQLAVKYLPQEDGTTQIKIVLMNPSGFSTYETPANATKNTTTQEYLPEASPFKSLNISLYWANLNNITDENWMNSLQIVNSTYYDTNGNVVTELSPSINKVR